MGVRSGIPRSAAFDSSLAFCADPYRFIANECARHRSELFETRLLLRRTICMTGPRAAELFYDSSRFVRAGAAPEPLRATLFGKGAVQGMDGPGHRHRKAMLMSVMTPQRIERLAQLVTEGWQRNVAEWASREGIVLYDELKPMLLRAACSWAGVPLADAEVAERSEQLAALYEGAAVAGLRHFRARVARKRAQAWLADFVVRVRDGRLECEPDSVLAIVALHRRRAGDWLSPRTAAVELLNLLRPTVAIAVYIVFVAHALHEHPGCRERLRDRETSYANCFAQEVRRFYPFFPAVVARVRDDFEWQGYHFVRGRRALLDLYGTDHDPICWDAPEAFSPERFRNLAPGAYQLVAQGGGEHLTQHRCAGERITIELVKVAAQQLAYGMTYEVPQQDLRIDFRRLPALPRDRFLMRAVRAS